MRIVLVVLLLCSGCVTTYDECAGHPAGTAKHKQCTHDVYEYRRVEKLNEFLYRCRGRQLYCDRPSSQRHFEENMYRYCRC